MTHEEGYETAEKKRLRDLKREVSRMDQLITLPSMHSWQNRDNLRCRFTTFGRYDYGEKTVYTCFRWSRIGHPKSNREKIVVFCAYESRSKTATFSRGKTIFAGRKRVFSVIHEQSRSKHLAHYLIVTYSLLHYR